MSFKPWTEIVNWAKSEGHTTEDVVQFFWWRKARAMLSMSQHDLFYELRNSDGKIGLARTTIPMKINQLYEKMSVDQILNESFKDDFHRFTLTRRV